MRIKYPRTCHLPWSLGISSDDKVIESLDRFYGKYIVCTEKRDGECTTSYHDGYLHARSIDGDNHPWQSWLKRFWQERCYDLPEGWRICGENLYAKHSISYELEVYFEGFSIWDDSNLCLSWKDTIEWFGLLGIKPVPILYEGIFDENLLKNIANKIDNAKCEGYVIRLANSFNYTQFTSSVAKFVRKNHVQTDQHWSKTWVKNSLNTIK